MSDIKIYSAAADWKLIRSLHRRLIKHNQRENYEINILTSLPYLENTAPHLRSLRESNVIQSWIRDSGAYSIMTGKKNVTLEEYAHYVNLFEDHTCDLLFNLDADFADPVANFYSQLMLEDLLAEKIRAFPHLRPAPVVHDKLDPVGELLNYVEHGYTYVALGSNGSFTDPAIVAAINKIRRDTGVKIHLFGRLVLEELEALRPDSADSASYGITGKFGSVNLLYVDPNPTAAKKADVIRVRFRERVAAEGVAKPGEVNYQDWPADAPQKAQFDAFLAKIGYTWTDMVANATAKQTANMFYVCQLQRYLNTGIP